jgi:hypothetical protein
VPWLHSALLLCWPLLDPGCLRVWVRLWGCPCVPVRGGCLPVFHVAAITSQSPQAVPTPTPPGRMETAWRVKGADLPSRAPTHSQHPMDSLPGVPCCCTGPGSVRMCCAVQVPRSWRLMTASLQQHGPGLTASCYSRWGQCQLPDAGVTGGHRTAQQLPARATPCTQAWSCQERGPKRSGPEHAGPWQSGPESQQCVHECPAQHSQQLPACAAHDSWGRTPLTACCCARRPSPALRSPCAAQSCCTLRFSEP